MKNINIKNKPVKFIFTLLAVLVATVTFAQTINGGGGGQGQGGTPPNGTGGPIDGGAVMLLVGVAGYAHSRLKLRNKEK